MRNHLNNFSILSGGKDSSETVDEIAKVSFVDSIICILDHPTRLSKHEFSNFNVLIVSLSFTQKFSFAFLIFSSRVFAFFGIFQFKLESCFFPDFFLVCLQYSSSLCSCSLTTLIFTFSRIVTVFKPFQLS